MPLNINIVHRKCLSDFSILKRYLHFSKAVHLPRDFDRSDLLTGNQFFLIDRSNSAISFQVCLYESKSIFHDAALKIWLLPLDFLELSKMHFGYFRTDAISDFGVAIYANSLLPTFLFLY